MAYSPLILIEVHAYDSFKVAIFRALAITYLEVFLLL